ncbi:hypothetical protein ROE7235_03102 [Roseibaca ekhonensis]|uniref:Uncharacterized protein n=1 Tax=Roseinatronobacter ekhonensis TaxID=254356 RepID=A0A3B0MCI3_9RHOB|nr:hypothetical protein [Roseibaca ekhonensis]SUZ33333.1 hypothetical protein ROE7235_03102 [Roseibaca ekhonensis]
MTQVKSLPERLATMPANTRWDIARRATQWVEDGGPNAERGAEALEDIAAYERARFVGKRIPIGALDWEPHEGQWLMRGFDGDKEVAGIEYTATHTASRKKVFRLTVLGRRHADMFHHVDEARACADELYRERTTCE